MVTLENLSLQRGGKFLLEGASAVLHPGQKVAVIGANGTGKSSLFQLLLGNLTPESGSLKVPPEWRIAHMAQEVAATDASALDFVLDGDGRLRELEKAIAEAETAADGERLGALHEQLDDIDGYTAPNRAAQLLQGLGFDADEAARPVSAFSGGWRIRLNLAQALMCPSDLLLLDEPTNHLDMDATLWLEQWLQRYGGTLLLISHDRDFIDNVCQRVFNIEHRLLDVYRGNYSAFERQRAEHLARQQASYEKQQRRVGEIRRFVSRFRAQANKARQAQSRLKELERMEELAPAHQDSPFDFSFPVPDRFSDPLLVLSEATLGYGDTPVLDAVDLSLHPGSRIGLLGVNGAGKSTLIKTLRGLLAPLAGERTEGEHLKIGYFSQHQLEALDLDASPVLHLQRLTPSATEQAIRNFLGGFNFRGDMATGPIRPFSGGEKARLALAIVVWQKPNLLLLDEPTNHLDMEMRHALTLALQGFEGALVLVSHDRHLIRNTVDQFVLVDAGRVREFDGDLGDYARWLQERLRMENVSAGVSNSDAPKTPVEKKQQRRQAAAAREKLQPLKKAIATKEREMATVAKQLATLGTKLANPDLYAGDNDSELQPLLLEQGELRRRQGELEERWLELNQELEDAVPVH